MNGRIGVGAAIAFVAAAMVMATGCGDSAGGSAEPLTKAQFIAQGNAICKEGLKEKNQAAEQSLDELSPEKRGDPATLERLLVEVALPPVREMAEEVGDLGAPKGDEAEVAAVLRALEAALDKAEAHPDVALNESEKIFGKSDKLASEYGLDACAQV